MTILNYFTKKITKTGLAAFLIGVILLLSNSTLFAASNTEFSDTKVSTNFINLIGLGDLNITVESKFKKSESILLGVHKNYDTETNEYSGEQGGFLGYRIYPSLLSNNNDLSGEYFQLTFGTNKETDGYATSVEFWIGKSVYLGTNLGIECGVGLGRKYKTKSNPMVIGGINLIYSL